MEVNTLVRHKKLKSLGIGCVSKVLKKSVRVNFGLDDTMTCKLLALEVIDDKDFPTINYSAFRNRILSTGGINNCIVGNELKEFVGIGWITLRVVTIEDLKKYPRVID
jgi:hypothetical protein